jgi:hypothetical protein
MRSIRFAFDFVDARNIAELRFDGSGGDGTVLLSSFIAVEALHLWLPQPSTVEPPARARSWAQLRGDVAARSVSAGPQDDSGLPQGQPRGHQEGFARPEGRGLSTDTMHMRLFTCWRAPPWSSNAIHSKGGRVRTRLLLRSDESRYQLGGKPAATDERSDRVFSHSTWAAIDPVEFVKRARDREVHEKELRLDKWLGNCMDTVRARRPRVQVRCTRVCMHSSDARAAVA